MPCSAQQAKAVRLCSVVLHWWQGWRLMAILNLLVHQPLTKTTSPGGKCSWQTPFGLHMWKSQILENQNHVSYALYCTITCHFLPNVTIAFSSKEVAPLKWGTLFWWTLRVGLSVLSSWRRFRLFAARKLPCDIWPELKTSHQNWDVSLSTHNFRE